MYPPGGLPRYPDLSRMSYSPNMPGISTGNMMIDMALSSMMGQRNFSAIPGQGQGVFDAYLTQQRSRQFLQAQQHGFGNSLAFQKLGGLSSGPAGQMATMLLGQPDGIMNSALMRGLNGGNPIKHMMGLNAGLTGQTMNMAFGSPANASFSQIKAAFDGQNSAMFTHKIYQQAEFDKQSKRSSQSLAKDLASSTAGAGLFGDLISTGKDGTKDFDREKFRKNAEKYAKLARDSGNQAVIDAYNKAFDSTIDIDKLGAKVGTKVQDKVDFTKTRGFESQDISSAVMMGMDLGMVHGGNRFSKNHKTNDKDMHDTIANASENAAVLMDAMKDISGTESTTGLMSELNTFMGKGQLNLGNTQQTKDVEKLLREFKGAARAAGISIESVMGIHAASQELASRFPQLQYRSGTALAKSNISAVQSMSAMTGALGGDWVRQQGGQKQLLETISASNIMATDETFIKESAGMAAMIHGSSLSQVDKDALLNDLNTTMGSGDMVDPGKANALRLRVASKLGTDVTNVLMTSKSTAAQRAGFDIWDQEEMQNKRNWNIPGAIGAMTLADMDKLAEVSGVDSSSYAKFKQDIAAGKSFDTALTNNGMARYGAFAGIQNDDIYKHRLTQQILETDPNSSYKKERDELRAAGSAYATDAAEFAKRGGALKASFSSVALQEILGGSFEGGMDGLMKTFTNSDKKVRADSILRAARHVADEGTTMSVKEAMLERAGGVNVGSTDELRKNLKTMGVPDVEIEGRIKQHDRLNNNEDWENMDKLGSLSMSEMLSASESDAAWERSRAKASGFAKGDVNRAAKFLNETGMAKSAGRYGKQSWNQSKQGMAIGLGVDAAAIMAAEEQISDINTRTDASFEKQMASGGTEASSYLDAIKALGPDVMKQDATGQYDTEKIMQKVFGAEDPNNPDSQQAKEAKEKLKKNAILSSAHAEIDNVSQTANSAGASAEKMMVDEFGKLSKQIGDSSSSVATAISQLVSMLGSFSSVSAN